MHIWLRLRRRMPTVSDRTLFPGNDKFSVFKFVRKLDYKDRESLKLRKIGANFLILNSIKKIENLENCLLLKELNLSGNKIRKVENIGNILINLNILMLSSNKIEYLEDINEIS